MILPIVRYGHPALRRKGVPVEVFSAEEPGADPKGKSRQAEPGRPAIYIE